MGNSQNGKSNSFLGLGAVGAVGGVAGIIVMVILGFVIFNYLTNNNDKADYNEDRKFFNSNRGKAKNNN